MSIADAPVVDLGDIDSTNAEALRRAEAGEPGPLWLLARSQSKGRGRAGRSWVSEPGNLFTSLLLPLGRPAPVAAQLSIVAGVAVHDALVALAQEPMRRGGLVLKWPNDLLLGGAKFSGILIESVAGPAMTVSRAVIGIGIDLLSHPGDLGRATTSLIAHGAQVTPGACRAAIAEALARRLMIWDHGSGFGSIRQAWLERSVRPGEAVAVKLGPETIEGAFAGLDDDGALLIVSRSGTTRRITFGDVVLASERQKDG